MKLHDLAPAPGSKKDAVRIGRGRAGRRGKTAGRGQKGAKARANIPPGYEGGQMPIHMRLPKLPGFKNYSRVEYTVVNVGDLARFDAGSEVDQEQLRARGIVKKTGLVKVLGGGELTHALKVKAHAFSASARAKIEGAGGSVELIER